MPKLHNFLHKNALCISFLLFLTYKQEFRIEETQVFSGGAKSRIKVVQSIAEMAKESCLMAVGNIVKLPMKWPVFELYIPSEHYICTVCWR